MKTLNQYELEKVSGGIDPMTVIAAIAAIGGAVNVIGDLGKGFARGWNE
ncbi:class IIb bacteriocin, lactobin A/cerein 7B family [Neisseria sp. oral taxon 014]|nr:class IIb bacteriocin, lactobin A/cerein 7B family [Neisseria sp. oral taxon 014]